MRKPSTVFSPEIGRLVTLLEDFVRDRVEVETVALVDDPLARLNGHTLALDCHDEETAAVVSADATRQRLLAVEELDGVYRLRLVAKLRHQLPLGFLTNRLMFESNRWTRNLACGLS